MTARRFESAESRFPGLPASSWFSGIEASRHDDGTVYVTVDNHRSNDFANYVYKSTDFGKTFTAIGASLPADRVARTIREDHKNPNVLYLGTEIGLFVTVDGGQQWVELKNNMPTMPFNDLTIQTRDNDLVLATHARGIWILDQLSAIQGLAAAAGTNAQLFPIDAAEQIRYTNLKAHAGDMIFRGENPPNGAIVDYWLAAANTQVALTVHDASGALVQTLTRAARPRRQSRRLEPAARGSAGSRRRRWRRRRGRAARRQPGGAVRVARGVHGAARGRRHDAGAEGRREETIRASMRRRPIASCGPTSRPRLRAPSASSRRWPTRCRRRRPAMRR